MIFIATYIRKLKDRNGSFIAPATRSTGVYLNDNQTLQNWINTMEENKFDILTVYPVGAIYQSTSNTSPASLFGGTWEKFTDRFLVGAGGYYSVNSTGGEEKHKLTIAEMPSHRHRQQGYFACGDGGKAVMTTEILSEDSPRSSSILNEGGDQPHNNMPPYYAVNIWRRTA